MPEADSPAGRVRIDRHDSALGRWTEAVCLPGPELADHVEAMWGAWSLLGWHQDELAGEVVDLAAVVGDREARGLREHLGDAGDTLEVFARLERWLRRGLAAGRGVHPATRWAVDRLLASFGSARVDRLAEAAGYSRKYLTRLVRREVGLPPKVVGRIAMAAADRYPPAIRRRCPMNHSTAIHLHLLLFLTTTASVSVAETGDKARFAPVADLAGHCWVGTFDNGARDVHCYEWALQGGFLRDRHQVTGGEGVYAGETFYGWDEAAGRLHFWYFNTLGGVSEGDAVRAEDGRWTFVESYQGGGGSLELRTAFQRPDEGSYAVVTEILRDGAWVPEREVVYRRLDVRPAATGGPWSEHYDLVFSTDRGDSYDVYRRDLRTGAEAPVAAAPETEWAYVARGGGARGLPGRGKSR